MLVSLFLRWFPFVHLLTTLTLTTGHLWVAGHVDADMLIKYSTPPYTSISPSQVNLVYQSH